MSLWRLGYAKTSFLGTLSHSLWRKPAAISWHSPVERPCGKELKQPTSPQVRVEADPPPSSCEATAALAGTWLPARDSEPQAPSQAAPWPTEAARISAGCFQPLRFWGHLLCGGN